MTPDAIDDVLKATNPLDVMMGLTRKGMVWEEARDLVVRALREGPEDWTGWLRQKLTENQA